MICIGDTRLQKLAVGLDEVVAAYMGSDSSFDYLPYLFCETYSIMFDSMEIIPAKDGVESNNIWTTSII